MLSHKVVLLSLWSFSICKHQYVEALAASDTRLNAKSDQYEKQQHQQQVDPIYPVHTLLLCRHGDSIWNGGCPGQVERFTGWTDVPLSKQGEIETQRAAHELQSYLYNIDVCFTSVLIRAQSTLKTCLQALLQHRQPNLPPVHVDPRLSERHYGALQGLVKADLGSNGFEYRGKKYDTNSVHAWRRYWHARPPPMDDDDPRRILELEQYSHFVKNGSIKQVPNGESLQMVADDRIRPFLDQVLTPILNAQALENQQLHQKYKHSENDRQQQQGDIIQPAPHATGLIVAHANSIRALLGVLCNVEDDPGALKVLESIRIPTGIPLVMQYQAIPTDCKSNSGMLLYKYKACPLPEPVECLIADSEHDGWWAHPNESPPPLGHVKLPVWPLNKCIPIEDNTGEANNPGVKVFSSNPVSSVSL